MFLCFSTFSYFLKYMCVCLHMCACRYVHEGTYVPGSERGGQRATLRSQFFLPSYLGIKLRLQAYTASAFTWLSHLSGPLPVCFWSLTKVMQYTCSINSLSCHLQVIKTTNHITVITMKRIAMAAAMTRTRNSGDTFSLDWQVISADLCFSCPGEAYCFAGLRL